MIHTESTFVDTQLVNQTLFNGHRAASA